MGTHYHKVVCSQRKPSIWTARIFQSGGSLSTLKKSIKPTIFINHGPHVRVQSPSTVCLQNKIKEKHNHHFNGKRRRKTNYLGRKSKLSFYTNLFNHVWPTNGIVNNNFPSPLNPLKHYSWSTSILKEKLTCNKLLLLLFVWHIHHDEIVTIPWTIHTPWWDSYNPMTHFPIILTKSMEAMFLLSLHSQYQFVYN